jgi:hypothetical protein
MASRFSTEELASILVRVKLKRRLQESKKLIEENIASSQSQLEAIQQELSNVKTSEVEEAVFDSVMQATSD